MTNQMTDERHYTEADLLETYYTEPGASMPVMMHLARCSDCAARYDRLSRKLRGLTACETERPESFWAKQRTSIVRGIDSRRHEPRFGRPHARLAAAAVFVMALGGVATWSSFTPAPVAPQQIAATSHVETADDAQIAADPWQSEQLRDLHDVVEWESWVDPNPPKGEQSL